MKRIMLILVLPLIIFQACKKEDSGGNQLPQESVLDYMPLTVGNYWVYESFHCDSGEINCESVSVDTNFVTTDTLIEGKTYFKIEGEGLYWNEPRYYRDSGDYIVDNQGNIIFTIHKSDDMYNYHDMIKDGDTIFYWYNHLYDQLVNINVNAGSFKCFDFRVVLYRSADDFQIEHNAHHMFSENVGPVMETGMFIGSLQVRRRELVGYFINAKSTIIP